MPELKNKVAVITGAGRGIGRSIAEALARAGVHLVLNGRDETRLRRAAEALQKTGAQVETVAGDAADETTVRRLVDAATTRWDRLDIAIANAGIGHRGPMEELDPAVWDAVLRTNLRAPFLLARAAVAPMKRAGEGDLVFIASLAGKNPVPQMSAYAASKWGLIGFARSLLQELRPYNIRILTVCPGSTVTDFGRAELKREKADRLVHPADIADLVVHALRTPRRASVSEFEIRPTNP